MLHRPVMVVDAVRLLNVKSGGIYLDATGGTGGFSRAILNELEDGRLITIDLDRESLELMRKELGGDRRLTLVQGNFADCSSILSQNGVDKLDGAIADLGMSSYQLENPLRGFSHRSDSPLDMRFDPDGQYPRVSDIIRDEPEERLREIIAHYGQQPGASKLAREIKKRTPRTTFQLADIVKKHFPAAQRQKALARVFMSFRIAVNREMENLEEFLEAVLKLLKPGGRLVTLSYHSLEDRIVKDFMKRESVDCLCPPEVIRCVCHHKRNLKILTPHPLRPSQSEVEENPRARSAKMRAGERILDI